MDDDFKTRTWNMSRAEAELLAREVRELGYQVFVSPAPADKSAWRLVVTFATQRPLSWHPITFHTPADWYGFCEAVRALAEAAA